MQRVRATLLALVSAAALPGIAAASPLFSDNFDSDTSANWHINKSGTAADQTAEFAYDYLAKQGIPKAPNTPDNSTTGLRLRANIAAGTGQSGLSLSPDLQALQISLGDHYKLTYDLWANFVGADSTTFPPGGLADNGNSAGGTQFSTAAVGTAGTTPQGINSIATPDSVLVAATGDGGSSNDYRLYPKSTTALTNTNSAYAATHAPPDANGAGATDNAHDYYEAFLPPQSAPSEQLTASPNTQGGQTQAGVIGFAWHTVELTKDGNTVIWNIDGHNIATFDASSLTLGGSNFAIGQYDFNSGVTNAPDLVFSVIDNLHVDAVPEPGSIALASIGGLLVLRQGRRRRGGLHKYRM